MLARAHDDGVGDDDPAAKARRRRFSAEYKLRIVAEDEALTDPGAKGALLRREGLYTSTSSSCAGPVTTAPCTASKPGRRRLGARRKPSS